MTRAPLTDLLAAPQHGPRPLPLFLDLLRSETAASPARRAMALAGLARYQNAPRLRRPAPRPPVARAGRATLRDHGGTGVPAVLVPSLINPPHVLDLAPGNSLAEWLVAQGHHVLLVDWGEPDPANRDDDVTAHVEALLLPMLRALGEAPVLVGYCLGGTMALGAAQAARARALALIAAPWRFAGYGGAARADMAALWAAAQPTCERLGLVPIEVLQSGFWRLDPARTVTKFEALATATDEQLAAFVALEDWANAGAPLTYGAGRQLHERFVAADDPGEGRWRIEGAAVDPAALTCPVIDFVSTRDRIVPHATSVATGERHDTAAGHVGMVVGGQAPALLWKPLADWLRGVLAPR